MQNADKPNPFYKLCNRGVNSPSELSVLESRMIRKDQVRFGGRTVEKYPLSMLRHGWWQLATFLPYQTAVTNAANLSLFMINLPQVLMCDVRQTDPDFGVLDLKSYYRGCKYATEMLKILPQKPDDILIAQLFRKSPPWAAFRSLNRPLFHHNWRRYCPVIQNI